MRDFARERVKVDFAVWAVSVVLRMLQAVDDVCRCRIKIWKRRV
jgi:hypothetical protein